VFKFTLFKIKGYLVLLVLLALARNSTNFDKDEIEKIVEAAKQGDAKAFESIYQLFSDSIYRYLYYMVGEKETAYDLTSQTFLKAYENIKSYRFKGYSFSAWLYKIAHNVAVDNFRSLKARPQEVSSDKTQEVVKIAEQSFEEKVVDRMAIENALSKLTEKQRQVMILKYIEQLNNPRIAEILGKTTSAVKALERRALNELKDIILLQRAKEQVYQEEGIYAGRR